MALALASQTQSATKLSQPLPKMEPVLPVWAARRSASLPVLSAVAHMAEPVRCDWPRQISLHMQLETCLASGASYTRSPRLCGGARHKQPTVSWWSSAANAHQSALPGCCLFSPSRSAISAYADTASSSTPLSASQRPVSIMCMCGSDKTCPAFIL